MMAALFRSMQTLVQAQRHEQDQLKQGVHSPVMRLASSFACHGRPVEADVLMLCCA
jgi:hypothetical protein